MRISDWSSDVCSSDLADLADEPFIMLERHPVARPPAMIAMPRRIERNHPIADPQRAFGAPRLLDAIGGAIGRTAARVGPIGIGRMKGFEIEIDIRLGGFPHHMRLVSRRVLLHPKAVDSPLVQAHGRDNRVTG